MIDYIIDALFGWSFIIIDLINWTLKLSLWSSDHIKSMSAQCTNSLSKYGQANNDNVTFHANCGPPKYIVNVQK